MDNELKWRKKPVVIEAFRWTGGPDQTEDPDWINAPGVAFFENAGTPQCVMKINTLEGVMTAQQGDWIIRGVKGEVYPCKPDIFEATYEPADRRLAEAPGVREAEREVIEWAEEARKYLEDALDSDAGDDYRLCGCYWKNFKTGGIGHGCRAMGLIHLLAAASKPADTKTEPKP